MMSSLENSDLPKPKDDMSEWLSFDALPISDDEVLQTEMRRIATLYRRALAEKRSDKASTLNMLRVEASMVILADRYGDR